ALKPGVLLSQQEIDDLKTGYYAYRAATALVSLALVTLAVWLAIQRRAAKPKAKPRAPRKKGGAEVAPQPLPEQSQAAQSSAAS
ncbi:MAG TPA: hypothetical protein VFW33_20730, partial [Gemmataceae bacterium]|nr:hypothetical protein [Gemmataceae bacterium]